MKRLFYNCLSLIEINLSSFKTNNVLYMEEMFYNCTELSSLKLDN